jgi:hypothetical protein
LQIKHRLTVGFVLGMKDGQRFLLVLLVLRALAVLFARLGVLAVIDTRSLKQDESRFHRRSSESKNQSGFIRV